jgi:hypothetical protein
MKRSIGMATVGGLTMSLGFLAFPEAAAAAPPAPPPGRPANLPAPAATRPTPAATAPGRTQSPAPARGQARAAAVRNVPAAAAARSNRPGSANRATGQARAARVQSLNQAAAAEREVATAAAAAAAAPAATPDDQGGGQGKVILCHATDSETNPYTPIEVATPAAVNAHLGHGDIASVGGDCPVAIVVPPAGESVTICVRTGIEGTPFALATVTAEQLPGHLAQGAVATVGGACPGAVVLPVGFTSPVAPAGRVLQASVTEATPARVEQQLLSSRVQVAENRGALPVTGVEVGSMVIVGLAMLVVGGRLVRSGRLRSASTASTASTTTA